MGSKLFAAHILYCCESLALGFITQDAATLVDCDYHVKYRKGVVKCRILCYNIWCFKVCDKCISMQEESKYYENKKRSDRLLFVVKKYL